MKLTDINPRWLLNEPTGRRWFLFRSPTGDKDWLTCRNFTRTTSEYHELYELCPDLIGQIIVGCEHEMAWKIDGDFPNLTVTPSIDASRSGNWHGFIRNGEIV